MVLIKTQIFLLSLFVILVFACPLFALGRFETIEYASPSWLDNETILAVKYISTYKKGFGILADISKGRYVILKNEIQIISMKIDGTDERLIKSIVIDWPNQSPKWGEEEFKGVNFIRSICYNPQKNLIAFGCDGGIHPIFIIRNDGTLLEKVTDEGFEPRWSGDGTKLLYTANNNLWLYGLDTNKTSLVLENARGGIWHPSGEKIYYAFDENLAVPKGNEKTYLLDVKDGSKELFHDGWEWPIDISEDGKVLLFYPWNILNDEAKEIARGYALNEPRLSPDGKKLVGYPINDEDRGFDICVINIDGSEKRLLR